MKKEMKDFIHLYLGCEVLGTYNDTNGSRGYLTGVTNGGTECEIQFILEDGINVEEQPVFNSIDEVKLILRPLSDMSEEEAKELLLMNDGEATKIHKITNGGITYGIRNDSEKYTRYFGSLNPPQFVYLLSRGFDLFELIPAGLAIKQSAVKR